VGGKKGRRVAARRVEPLPAGSVEVEHAIAEGVAGMVVTHPVASIDVERMVRDTEVDVDAEVDTKTTQRIR
jgi:hypothetical protein